MKLWFIKKYLLIRKRLGVPVKLKLNPKARYEYVYEVGDTIKTKDQNGKKKEYII